MLAGPLQRLGVSPDGSRVVFEVNEEFALYPVVSCSVGEGYYRVMFQDPVTRAVVFASSCDPLGINPYSAQIFAMRPDGRGLRQLTDATGFTSAPDGSIRVELPGPFAHSATPAGTEH